MENEPKYRREQFCILLVTIILPAIFNVEHISPNSAYRKLELSVFPKKILRFAFPLTLFFS